MTARRLIRAAAVAGATAILVMPVQGSHDAFFDDASVVEFTVEAPLQQLFERGVRDESFSVPAKVFAAGASSGSAGELSVRGNTSRKECPFPKLKLKMDGNPGAFGGLRAVKINTHCGEASDDTLTRDFGRLANEKSPWREGVVYRIAQAAGARTPRARPARITYVDTSPSASPQRLVRNALIVEDDDDVRKRLEASGEITPAEFTNARELFSPDDVARVAFTEALIGNFDWCLMMYPNDGYRCDARKKLWNLTALRTAAGAVPVLQDFDLAGPVTGRHVWFDRAFTRDFVASEIDTEVIAQVQRTRTLFDRARLNRVRQDFLVRRQAIMGALETSAVDPRGAELSRAYVDAFFRAIADDRDFYRPVIARAGVRIFADAAGQKEVCGTGDTVPPGTPFKELRRENGRAQVQLLDALWRWAPPNECAPVHKGPVWIDPSAISDDFPAATTTRTFGRSATTPALDTMAAWR